MTKRCDVLYCEGTGDIVSAYAAWKQGKDLASETSGTFSSQLFEFCRLEGLTCHALAYSYYARPGTVVDASYTVQNLPRSDVRVWKVGYELTAILYAVRLLLLALRVRPRVILICSGVTDWAYLSLLRLSGAKIVPILHNTLWPEGFPPTMGLRQRVYRFVWRRSVWLTLAVSLACARQVRTIGGATIPVKVFKPSFPVASFGNMPSPRDFSSTPFRVMFAGRIEEEKGVFDILDMAERLPSVEFSLCGIGLALPEVARRIEARHLKNVITHGQLNRPQLIERYLDTHLVIVPTRSTFAEGFAMVAAEAILLLRPVLASFVVPASEVLGSAMIVAETDNVAAFVRAIQLLCRDERSYAQLVENARALRSVILDDSTSFLTILRSTLSTGHIG